MVYDGILMGMTVQLRPITEEDATFVLHLRQDPNIARYLHKLDISVEQQKEWIRTHNAMQGDYNFIICDLDDTPVGMIGLCNIRDGKGEPGRLASFGTALQNIEACLMINDLGFEQFGLDQMVGRVVAGNGKVISMQQKIGFVFDDFATAWDGMDIRYARMDKSNYLARRDKLYEKIRKAAMLQ